MPKALVELNLNLNFVYSILKIIRLSDEIWFGASCVIYVHTGFQYQDLHIDTLVLYNNQTALGTQQYSVKIVQYQYFQ
jgi:hypothetical protein